MRRCLQTDGCPLALGWARFTSWNSCLIGLPLIRFQALTLLQEGKMDPEEQELLNDYRYKNYSSVIEKALRNFESSSEWADLISSLGKLNKVCGRGAFGWRAGRGTAAVLLFVRHCLIIVARGNYNN